MIDWKDECVAIIASGPSANKVGVEKLRGRMRVLAIKRSLELCPWADAVYGCDGAWWKSVDGLPEFGGAKLSWNGSTGGAKLYSDIIPVGIEDLDKILTETKGTVGSGGNSGFQALNLAVQFGARGILLVGYDMQDRSGAHWYGRNNWRGANNPTNTNFDRWQRAFRNVAAVLSADDIQVFNTSSDSALTCFQHKTIDQALEFWGL